MESTEWHRLIESEPKRGEWVQVLMTTPERKVGSPSDYHYAKAFACVEQNGNWRRLVPIEGMRAIDPKQCRIDFWRDPPR